MRKKLIASVAGISLLLGASAGVYAGANLETIQAYLNHTLTVKVNGVPAQLNDEQGNAIVPITYQGSTYLPVRAIANALGVAVDYDVATTTVLLGEKVDGISITGEEYDGGSYLTSDPKRTIYQNKDYKEVLYNNVEDNSSNGSGSFMLTPDKKYQKLYLQAAAINKEFEISIYESGTLKLLKQDTVTVEDKMKTIEANIGGISDVYIEIKGSGGGFVIPLTTSYYK
ncbi:stalk domain-containing protein [Paenibacillus hodogayensis]|uniref:Stalk domain-containing protein n=1 Tax=Paenibacillus hodogayensis TaxID=279208 RepID=A0ABV5VY98_9BACL